MCITIEFRAVWLTGREGNHDICMMMLRTNVCCRIHLTESKLPQHLFFRISALGHVPSNLPASSQFLGWIKVNANTVGVAHLLPVHAEQTFNDDIRMWNDILWGSKVTRLVIIVRLQDRLPNT